MNNVLLKHKKEDEKRYERFFNNSIQALKDEGRYRYFQTIKRHNGDFPQALHVGNQQDVTVWCSNDYLGMGQHPVVIEAMKRALDDYGAGAGGTRNISGTHKLVQELEKEVASLHQKDAGLIFTSGYVANEASLSCLCHHMQDCVIFSDSKNHASMIQGMRLGKAKRVIFPHNDLIALEKTLNEHRHYTHKIIAFESVYSMDGDIAPIKEICQLAKKHNALTYLDEVHAVGIYGKEGAGMAEHMSCMHDIDIIQGTFAKAYGVMGGYIASTKACVDFIRSYASSFIFSTALAPALTAGAIASIRHLRHSDTERYEVAKHTKTLRIKLQNAEIRTHNEPTHIISVFVRDPVMCRNVANRLLNVHRIYIQPINYPTVDRGQERLRISVTALHDEVMQDNLVFALKEVLDYYHIL